MKPFLQLVAENLFARFGQNMNDCTVVFPNRRSILYFNKYLSELELRNPVWAPQCTTISDFVIGFSQLEKADDLLLIFELYDVYCKIRNSTESFDHFYFWGELMLSDFNDIDKYLVNAEDLFKNLSSLKNINEQFSYLTDIQVDTIKQFWTNFEISKESTQRSQFSDLWSSLFSIYKTFRERLLLKGLAYEGLIYREASEIVANNRYDVNKINKIAFVGFNALNSCEKVILNKFRDNKKALFYWDYDVEYYKEYHEAGFFFRKNIEAYPSALGREFFSDLEKNKEINVIDIPSFTGQAKQVGSILKKLQITDASMEKTAILLADENLLIPVLQSIPKDVEAVNITMGYQIVNTQLVALIETILKLHSSAKGSKNTSKKVFYYKQVLEIIGHPYIEYFCPGRHALLSRETARYNRVYLSSAKFEEDPILQYVFKPVNDGIELLERLLNLIKTVGNSLIIQKNNGDALFQNIDSEVFVVVFKALNRLSDLLKSSSIKPELPLYTRLIMKVLKGVKIPFEGEPLQGLQIMGFLESRALDFENLIILSVNEGNLPTTNMPISFIPHNLRYGFGLPTLEHRDAMYAYYFYRVLQRSSNISLVFDSRSASVGNSEVSRYVTQLRYSGKYNIKTYAQSFNIVTAKNYPITIEKSPDIIDKLNKFTISNDEKFLSPSALSNYIKCSLRFYFKYIEKINEYEEPAEEIDARILGNILHTAIYELYKPLINIVDTSKDIEALFNNEPLIEEEIKRAMKSQYFMNDDIDDEEIMTGRNFILFKILKRYSSEILRIDSKIKHLTIKALESNVAVVIPVKVGEKEVKVRVGGNIDRVDEVNNVLRIIDYKTGSVDHDFKALEDLFSSENKKHKKEIFQSILYSYLYTKYNTLNVNILPGLYSVRKLFSDEFDASLTIDKQVFTYNKTVAENFEILLKKLLSEIFDPGIVFVQTSNVDECKYCDYNSICHR